VNCSTGGVRVERLPWAHGKERTTRHFQWFLASGARRLLWIGEDRTKATLERFFRIFGNRKTSQLKYIASGLPDGGDEAGIGCDPHLESLPHRQNVQQGDRSGSGAGGSATEGKRP
jgi:hypothetical protein